MKKNTRLRTATAGLLTAAMLLCASFTLRNTLQDTRKVSSGSVTHSLTVLVTDAKYSAPLQGAKVMLIETGEILSTNKSGSCTFYISSSEALNAELGTASVAVACKGYAPFARFYIEMGADREILAPLGEDAFYSSDVPNSAYISSLLSKLEQ